MNPEASAAATAVCGLATPPGRAAVATILWRGPLELIETPTALFRAANGRRLSEQTLDRIVYGHWGEAPPEDVVACRTSDETLEIHCHGGDQAAGRILEDLVGRGARRIAADAFANVFAPGLHGQLSATLERAATTRTADFLLAQLQGLLEDEVRHMRQLAEPVADETSATGRLMDLKQRLDGLLRWSDFGRHLTEPWRVVLAGRTNVGKSSLINAILGFRRSIVFNEPGTTRDVVTAETALDGWPVCLSDTAGLRAQAGTLEAAGIARTLEQLSEADCRLIVIDASQPLHPLDRQLLQTWPDAICVANKCDLPLRAELDEVTTRLTRVSARTGRGLDELLDGIAQQLVPQVPLLDRPLPVCPSQVQALQRARGALDGDQPQLRECQEALDELLSGYP